MVELPLELKEGVADALQRRVALARQETVDQRHDSDEDEASGSIAVHRGAVQSSTTTVIAVSSSGTSRRYLRSVMFGRLRAAKLPNEVHSR